MAPDEVLTDQLAAAAERSSREAEEEPTGEAASAGAAGPEHGPLLSADDTQGFRTRWERVQASFVDEPRRSVEEADQLVAQIMKRLAESFAAERERLEGQWDRGDEVDTDALRIALQRYRSFFDRLLEI
jgi:hypothetical protein